MESSKVVYLSSYVRHSFRSGDIVKGFFHGEEVVIHVHEVHEGHTPGSIQLKGMRLTKKGKLDKRYFFLTDVYDTPEHRCQILKRGVTQIK